MLLKKLEVENFRNIQQAQFIPSQGLTVICGMNGQGKTNLLESIWLLTGSKSFRTTKDTALVRETCEFARIQAVTENQIKENEIQLLIGSEESTRKGRTAKCNGADLGRATNLAGTFTAVVFEPNHLSLVKSSGEGRRRFVDAALCQLYPQYIVTLRRYERQIKQKNALLKEYYKTSGASELLDVYNEGIAQTGNEIIRRRKQYLSTIAPFVVETYCELASGKETLELQYIPSAEEDLLPVLQEARAADIRAGVCTAGPHREDFSVMIDGREARAYGSQGQQRSAVLSLKLAEAKGAFLLTGEHPVMLLDDVLSELDDMRQAYLLNRMDDKQTIVTACNAELFHKTNGKIYSMKQGVLQERG